MSCVRGFWVLLGVPFLSVWMNAVPCYAQFIPTGNVNVSNSINNFLYNRPTLSPYLNLTRTDTGQIQPNYHALVRPELQRRQQQAAQTAQIRQLNRSAEQFQGSQMRSQRDRDRQLATGHPTRFFTYLHFYPEPTRPQQMGR